jgi:ankyrin repeat protein
VKVLLRAGADAKSYRDSDGCSALHIATAAGHISIAKALHAAGADLGMRTGDGSTALIWATVNEKPQSVRWLLANGADPNASVSDTPIGGGLCCLPLNVHGRTTALYHAAHYNLPELVKLLLAGGAHVNERTVHCWRHTHSKDVDTGGRTALQVTAQAGHLACAELLLAAGADVRALDNNNFEPLHWALLSEDTSPGCLAVARAIIDAEQRSSSSSSSSSRSSSTGRRGTGPLLNCVLWRCKTVAAVQMLLSKGARVEESMVGGYNSLHGAAAYGQPAPVICMLVKAGADPTALDDAGETPAQVAEREGNTLAAQLLTRAARDYKPGGAAITVRR